MSLLISSLIEPLISLYPIEPIELIEQNLTVAHGAVQLTVKCLHMKYGIVALVLSYYAILFLSNLGNKTQL